MLSCSSVQRTEAMYDSPDNTCGDSFFSRRDRGDVGRGVFTGLCAPIDLLEQTRRDELSLPAISVGLRRWALQQEDVHKIAVGYVGGQYSVAILFTELQLERISGLHEQLRNLWPKFRDCTAVLYAFGPAQRDSLLLNSADCHVVYAS